MSNGLYPNPAAYTRQQAQQIIGRIIDEREQSDFPTAYIPGCKWQDPEDGCCLHHDNMTPECTVGLPASSCQAPRPPPRAAHARAG